MKLLPIIISFIWSAITIPSQVSIGNSVCHFEGLRPTGLSNTILSDWTFGTDIPELRNAADTALYEKAIIKIDNKQFEAGLEILIGLKENNPNSEILIFEIGYVYQFYLENPDAARPYYEKVIDNNYKHAEAHSNLGLCFSRIPDYKKAISHYLRAASYDKKNIVAYNNVACAYWKDQDVAPPHLDKDIRKEALRYLDSALVRSTRDTIPTILINRGLAHLKLDSCEKAEMDFTLAIRKDSVNADAYFHRGLSLHCQGRHGEAQSDIRKAFEIQLMPFND